MEFGPDGGLYSCEVENHRIHRYDLDTGALTTVAGTGRAGYSGDGGPATTVQMDRPHRVCVGPDGGPATTVQMDRPHRVCVGPDGAVYVGGRINGVIRAGASRGSDIPV